MKRGILYLLFIVMLLQTSFAHAQSELWGTDYIGKAIFKFDGNNPGPANFVKKLDLLTAGAPDPWAGLTLYSNGKLYGTTQGGGSSNLGVLFEYDPATAIFTKKVDFVGINGSIGEALTLAANGKLYGTTSQGGVSNNGVLFEYDPVTNTYTKKVDFDGTLKGSGPETTLTPAPNGKLYGMTGSGGAFSLGVLFEYDPATSTYTKRVDFSGTANGAGPRSGPLAVGGNGKLYGVTFSGGASNGGVLFEFDPSTNVFTKKVDFSNVGVAGYYPVGGLVLAGNGKLYGTTIYGNPSSLGVLFEYDYVTNSYAVKHDFLPDDAGQEVNAGLTLAGNGKLYGVTDVGGGLGDNGTGALFEYDPTSNTFTTKMQFNHYSNPDHPFSVYGSLLYAQTQTITGFAAIPNKTYGDAPFTVSAIGGASGKPVTFISSDQTIATVSGNTVAITGIGTVTITAHQAGTTAYLATATSQTFTVSLGPPKTVQSITFNSLADKVVGDAAFSLTGTATSGLPVTYTSSNTAVATVSGSTVTIVGAGAAFITASQEGNATFYAAVPVTQALTVTKTNQTITFSALADQNIGDANFNLAATASSGLPVNYTSSNPSVATISGSTVTIAGPGITIITASQAGNASYNAAAPASQTLTVNKSNQTITFNTLADKNVGDANFNLAATASSSLAVSYTSSNTSIATVSGSTVTIVGGGTTIITASQAGNASYNAATSVLQTLTVNKSNQTITFNALADKNVGDANFNLTATASSSLAVSYSSSNTSVATVSGNTVTIVGGGTTIITALQDGNSSYNAAAPVSQTLTVNKSNQTITFGALANKNIGDANFNLTATVSSSLAVSYSSSNTSVATVSGSTVTIVGGGTTIITASQAGNASYNAATSVTQILTVNKSNQVINFSVQPNYDLNTASFNLTATATSGLQVTYTSSNTGVATISGSTVTLVGAGTTIITASQNGNSNVNAAVSVSRTVTVSKLYQTITGLFGTLNRTIGDAAFDLSATSTSALPVSYASSNSSVASISGSTVTIVGAGTAMITASQEGNATYNAATSVTGVITVNKSDQTISFGVQPTHNMGEAPFDLTATATSGLPVTYNSSNPFVAIISGSTVTLVGAGTAVITASQNGNASFNAAVPVTRTITVNKLFQSITGFNSPPLKNVGDAAFDLTSTATSGLPVSYMSSNPSVASISGSTVTILRAGTVNITAAQGGNDIYNAASPLTQMLIINKLDQGIAFDNIPNKTMGDAAFDLTATSNSGLPVTYTSSNTFVATVSGSTVTIKNAGTTIITALQPGNATYNAAISISKTLTVNRSLQSIAFGPLAPMKVGDPAFNLTATSSSGLEISYDVDNQSVATISGSTINIVGAGTAKVTAYQWGDPNYNAATPVVQILTVNKSNQNITFSALDDKSVGDANFNLTATTSSSLAISYASSNPSVATVSGNTVTIVGGGTTTITAYQGGNSTYNAATPVSQALTVNKSNQTIMFDALTDKNVDDANFNLTATASSSLAVSYSSSNTSVATISGNTVTIVGIGPTIITASQTGNGSYNAATPVSQTLTVNKTNQAITFTALADKNVGDANFNLTATASSSLPVSYTSSNTSVATVSGNTVTIVGGGTTIITASQAGNTTYSAAPDVPQSLTVNKGNQTITFGVLSAKTFGDAPFTLTGTASSGLAVNYVSSNTSVALVSGSTLIIVGAGSSTITASQAGNASYNVATSVPQTLTVNKANQVITFSVLPDKAVGDASFNLTATASSGLPVTYLNGNSAVATLSGSTVTVVGVGTTSFLARQSGNSNYNAATPVAQGLTVNRIAQSISNFTFLSPKNVGDAPFTLTATASSGLPVAYISSNTSVATISGSTLTIVGGGSTTIDAVQGGNDIYAPSATWALPFTVNKLDQAISFIDLTPKTVGDAPFNLTATASSGLPLTYTSNNPSVATISGNTVTIVGAGTATITASQAGNSNYNLATPVSRSLAVNRLNQTITFSNLASETVGDAAFNLTATTDSGLPLSFTSSNPSVATISGSTVTLVGGGSTIITALQPGNATYEAAISATQMLTVNKADQTITFNALADKNVGDPNFNLTATASSSLAVAYTSSNTSVATVSGNTVMIVGAGTTIITASQAGNATYNSASPVTQTLAVNKSNQSITFGLLASKVVSDAAFNLTALTSSGLSIMYTSSNTAVATISGNTVTIVGIGTTIITASQAGNANYNAAPPVSQSFAVTAGLKADQTISFNPVPEQFFGDGTFILTATTSSGLPVTYVSSDETVAAISGNVVTLVGGGITIITASQSGNASYNPAIDVMRALKVNVGGQDITFDALPSKIFGDAPFTVAATSTSGLPVSYVSSNSSVAVVSNNLITILGAGTATITAWQGGNRNYNAANNVDQTLTVSKANQTLTFNAPSSRSVEDASFDLAGTTNAGLTVSYASSNPLVATISGNTVTIVGAGTTVITASQQGNTNYNAATDVQRTLTVHGMKADQTITFNGLADKTVGDAAFELTASASSGLAISYTSSNASVATVLGNTVTIVGPGTTIISASQSGSDNFVAAPTVSQILTVMSGVNKSSQTITFNTLVDRTMGDTPFALSAVSSSGLAVAFSTTSDKITISGNQATIVGAGRASITATQAGNASFNAATSVERSFCIKPAKPTVALSNPNTESPILTSSAKENNQWFLNGSAIAGATNSQFTVTQPGVYTVQTKADDCLSDFSLEQVLIVTGEIENNFNTSIDVYPNPATDHIIVTLGDLPGKKEVALFNLKGIKINEQTIDGDKAEFQVADLASAVYFVRVTTGSRVKMMRFVKN